MGSREEGRAVSSSVPSLAEQLCPQEETDLQPCLPGQWSQGRVLPLGTCCAVLGGRASSASYSSGRLEEGLSFCCLFRLRSCPHPVASSQLRHDSSVSLLPLTDVGPDSDLGPAHITLDNFFISRASAPSYMQSPFCQLRSSFYRLWGLVHGQVWEPLPGTAGLDVLAPGP